MKKSKRFEKIVDLAHDNERKAAEALGIALNKLEQAMHRLDDLRRYQNEYMAQFNLSGQNGMTSTRAVDYHLFLEKLRYAMSQQERVIDQAKNEWERSKAYWFAQRGRSKAMDNVLARYIADERKLQEKREQREVDERNNRRR